MSWILIALSGYFLAAVAVVFDKFLLRSRIPEPSVYAFMISLFSLFAFIFAPFGLQIFHLEIMLLTLLSGVLFTYGILALYKAIKENEVSRVAPLVGAIIPLGTLSIVSSGLFGTKEILDGWGVGAFCMLLVGGIIISFQKETGQRGFFRGFPYALIAGLLLALSFVLLKYAFSHQNFVSGLVWSRAGMFLGGVSLFLIPQFREKILNFCREVFHKKKESASTGGLFILNKTLAGVSYLFINYAIYLGPVTLVQAMSSSQYAFVFVLSVFAALKWPSMFEERRLVRQWAQKIVALACIAVGIYFASQSGEVFFF